MTDCPAELLTDAAQLAGQDPQAGLDRVDRLLGDYREDGRLHFLRGSLLAGLKHYDEARRAMATAMDLAPGFALARFQLGFLSLTCDDAAAADTVLAPLDGLEAEHPLRLFGFGLRQMMHDDFPSAIAALERGMALNTENAPLNADMRLLVQGMSGPSAETQPAEPTSSAQMLLSGFNRKPTRH